MIVADSSPLIALGRTGQLHLLHSLFGTVIIPPAVSEEIGQRPEGFTGGRPEWLQDVAISEPAAAANLRLVVDPGEAEAIILARELHAKLIIDDEAGRRVAESLGVEFTGTLGVLLLAKQRGLIPSVGMILSELISEEFFVSARLVADVLRLAEEDIRP